MEDDLNKEVSTDCKSALDGQFNVMRGGMKSLLLALGSFLLLIVGNVDYLKGQEIEQIQLINKRSQKVLTLQTPALSRIRVSDTISQMILYQSHQGWLVTGRVLKEGRNSNNALQGENTRTVMKDTLDFDQIESMRISTSMLHEKKYRTIRKISLLGFAACFAYPFIMPKETSNAVYIAGAVPLFFWVGGYFYFATKKFKPAQWEILEN